MPLYEVTPQGLSRHTESEFSALGLYERADLQRLLRDDISVLDEDLLVISEEFRNWEDARRRIDLLALDKSGRLVVIELKRTEDGGHMDLQAIRYAAMISSMGFEEVVQAYESHCAMHRPEEVNARAELEAFLDTGEGGGDPVISSEVRIILLSADFGREITTTVLWLNGFEGMDVRCIRLRPYEIDGRILLDIQQVLPLPEAADYQIRLRRKDAARDRARTDGRDFTRFHVVVEGEILPDENKRNAMRVMVSQLVGRGVAPHRIREVLPTGKFLVLSGQYHEGSEVRDAIASEYPKADAGRLFTDHPFVDEETGETYILTKMWGRRTEALLAALTETFSEAKVTFQRAESS